MNFEVEETVRVGNNAFTLISQDNEKWTIRHSLWTIENISFKEAYEKLKEFDVEPLELYAAIQMMAEREHNTAYFGNFGSFLFTKYEDLNGSNFIG